MKKLMTLCMVMLFMLAVSSLAMGELVSYWSFDEGGGTVAGDSIGTNDGTVVGATWTTGGAIGGALEFDGTNDYVDLGTTDLFAGWTKATIAFLAKPEVSSETWPCTFAKWTGTSFYEAPAVGIYNPDDTWFWEITRNDTGANVYRDSLVSVDYGAWQHIVYVFDFDLNEVNLYKNGTLAESWSVDIGDCMASGTDTAIGGVIRDSIRHLFKGALDEVAIWNHPLSADDVDDLYNSGGVPRACVRTPPGIVGWWPGDGNADDIIGGNHGTLVGDATFAAGKVGDAFTFSGSDTGYVRIPNNKSLEPEKVTVDAWVRANGSPGSSRYIVAKGALTCTAASYALYTGGRGLCFYVFNGSSYVPSPVVDSGIWDNQWHHVAGTYDGEHVRLYVDGAEVGSGTATTISIKYDLQTDRDLIIGQYAGTCSLPFQGDIDEVEIFDHALSGEEIQDIFYAGSAGKCIDVQIDIKPGSDLGDDNTISLSAQGGLMPVAILSDCDEESNTIFDATTVDPATVALAGAGAEVRMQGKGITFMAQKEDVNGDGCPDLVIHIAVVSLDKEDIQDGSAVLTGETYEGKYIVGLDNITIVPE